jgi:hypothetical protein
LIVGLGGIQFGQPHAHKLARITADGQVEQNSFVDLVPADVTALAIDHAGNILVAGRFNSIAGQSRHGLARIVTQSTSETRISAARVTPGGLLEIQIEAAANKALKIQTSSDLQTWTEYTTVTTGMTTTLWTDSRPLSARQQLFYRVAE